MDAKLIQNLEAIEKGYIDTPQQCALILKQARIEVESLTLLDTLIRKAEKTTDPAIPPEKFNNLNSAVSAALRRMINHADCLRESNIPGSTQQAMGLVVAAQILLNFAENTEHPESEKPFFGSVRIPRHWFTPPKE